MRFDKEDYAPNSESSKIRWSLCSIVTLKPVFVQFSEGRGDRPALRRAAVVVGVRALRCSAVLVSARR